MGCREKNCTADTASRSFRKMRREGNAPGFKRRAAKDAANDLTPSVHDSDASKYPIEPHPSKRGESIPVQNDNGEKMNLSVQFEPHIFNDTTGSRKQRKRKMWMKKHPGFKYPF